MRTGFEKVTQVLGDALLRGIADDARERKLVAFTDSRQDAAKLSAGLGAAPLRGHGPPAARSATIAEGNPERGSWSLRCALGLATDHPRAIAGFERSAQSHATDANLRWLPALAVRLRQPEQAARSDSACSGARSCRRALSSGDATSGDC